MNKILRLVKTILLIILIVLNIYCFSVVHAAIIRNMLGYNIYLFLLFFLILNSFEDIVRKYDINKNNTYHIITIIILLIMNVILCRTLYDSSLFFNNVDLINKYVDYYKMINQNFDYYANFDEAASYYFKQNMIYFNIMLLLLFAYRRINLGNRNRLNN